MERIKYFFSTQRGKTTLSAIISFLVATLLMLVIFLPIVFSSQNLYGKSVVAYNRDANSGTREAFEKSINFNSDRQKYSRNVLQVSGNDDMLNKIKNSTNSIGYVSLFSAIEKDSDGEYQTLDGIDILKFDGIDPIEDIENNMDNYHAKRYFNVFLRVDQKYNDLISKNMFGGDPNNAFTSGGTIVGDSQEIIDFRNDYGLKTEQDLINFYASFLYYNWLIYSPDAKTALELSLSKGDPDFNNTFQNFLDNVDYVNLVQNNDLTPIIYTVGSSSVTASLNHTRVVFDDLFPSGTEPQFELLNNGSGDAFKSDNQIQPQFANHFWLGFQSRSPKDEEMNLYNQSFIATDNNYSDIEQNIAYFSFDIDAIAFIVNDHTSFKVNNTTYKATDISDLGVNLIYTQGVSFSFLYESELLEGVKV